MSILDVKNVSIRYMTGDFKEIGLKEYILRKLTHNYHVNEFWADKNVSFTLEKGEMLGIIGANGAGKSTLLKVISGIMEPSEGSVHREGTVAALLELGSGFDQDLTVQENTYLRGAMLGYTKRFMDDTYDQIIEFAELQDFQDRPFKQLSSGMQRRLAFSIASMVKPDILILDEVLAVGDGAFRKKSEEKMREILSSGATTILVSHSLDQVRELCDKVLWLHKGEQIAYGENVQELCDQYEAFLEGGMQPEDLPHREPARVSPAKEEKTDMKKDPPETSLQRKQERKKDAVCIGVFSLLLFFAMFILHGFGKYGLDAPFGYGNGDDLIMHCAIKTVMDTGWVWFNPYVGAPLGSPFIDIPLFSCDNFEYLVVKILAFLSGNNLECVINLQYLLIFPMCAVTAFIALRSLKVRRGLSLFGAFLFSCAPFIFARGTHHFYLATCYFVPLVVLLTVWACDESDTRYLRFKKGFFRYGKNWAAIVCALLIGNNGNGYYPFMACYILCVVCLYGLLHRRSLSTAKRAALSVLMIGGVFVLALVPYVAYQVIHGVNQTVSRGLNGIEIYGLKITQFFIPLDDHGIDLLKTLISKYNNSMPLVNENTTAYLSIAGIAGFILSLFTLFIPEKKDSEDGGMPQILSQMSLFSVLFGTIGGFSVLFAIVTGFNFIRSVNRISIFIAFFSICILCLYIQKLLNWISRPAGSKVLKGLTAVMLAGFAALCVWELLPRYGASDAKIEANQKRYDIEENFIQSIAAQLEDGDMVYQLPYHKFMEGGWVNQMGDYQLFTGYLHTEKLRWSYGGVYGREADEWNAWTDMLPMDARIDVIVNKGFKGIYVDAKAYTPEELEELRASIEAVLKEEPMTSEDGLLLFYDLAPYISAHPELADKVYYPYALDETVYFNESEDNAHLYFTEGMSKTETNFAWTDGDHAAFCLSLTEEEPGDLVLDLILDRVYNGKQRLTVKCGDEVLFDEDIRDPKQPVLIRIPQSCVHDGLLELSLELPDAVSPASLGKSSDVRNLALGLSGFTLSRAAK